MKNDDVLEIEENEGEETEAFVEYDIATYPSDNTLDGIYRMWNEGNLIIPEYQRNFVWTIHQSSLLIESFLLGLPIPPVFFYVNDENINEVIDGQQRIMSFIYFFDGYFGREEKAGVRQIFRLTGLSKTSPLSEKKYSELPEPYQRKLKYSVLRAINIKQLKPNDHGTVAYHIFERLNTGGTPLKPQEIRNVVFRGGLVQKLRQLNDRKSWREIIGKNIIDKHQKDVELILRLFALSTAFDEYEKPMKEFLNKSMKKNKVGDTDDFIKFYDKFPKICDFIIDEIGKKPFHLRGPINLAALDGIMVPLIKSDELPKEFKKNYREILLVNKEFNETTYYSTSDKTVIQDRFEIVKKIIFG